MSGDIRPPRRIPRGLFALCLLSIAGLASLPLLQVGDGKNVPPLALFFGRFHPVILHVPIGLILLALVLEHAHVRALRQWIPKVPPDTSTFLMFAAALSAVVSTVLGWMLSYSGGYDPVLLQRHFLAGLFTAIGANVALLLKLVADAYPGSRMTAFAYQLMLLATGASLGLAGHLGASITHGEDYLTEYAPNPIRHALGLPPHIDPADQPFKPLPERIVFADVVGPVLTERCVGCHSGQKAKGGLRLDAFAQVMKGGDSGAVVIAGDPAKSNLLRYLDLPENDSKHMPPKGKTQVSEDEHLILSWWVEAGAPENKTLGELPLPDDVHLALERNVPEAVRAKQDAARREKVARLANAVLGVQKRVPGMLRAVAPGEPELEYSAGLDPARFGDGELRELGSAVGEDIVWLDLRRTRVTDAGLQTLAKMPNLRRLQLQETKAGDAGLTGIRTLAKLEVLNLYDTPVGDRGLASLGTLKNLRKLYVWRTAATDAGEAALRKQLPKLEIVTAQPMPNPPPTPYAPLAPVTPTPAVKAAESLPKPRAPVLPTRNTPVARAPAPTPVAATPAVAAPSPKATPPLLPPPPAVTPTLPSYAGPLATRAPVSAQTPMPISSPTPTATTPTPAAAPTSSVPPAALSPMASPAGASSENMALPPANSPAPPGSPTPAVTGTIAPH